MPHVRQFALIAIIAALAGCASTTNPGAVDITRRQLLIVPASTVDQMAAVNFKEQNDKARAAGHLIDSGPELERLHKIAVRLERQAPVFRADAASWQWELALIDQPEVNASCAPGGKITVYTGLIRKLQLSDAEIAMVLGHEIAHALREHGRERLSQAAAQNVITSAALGALGTPEAQSQMAKQFADIMYALPNSRKNETEADQIGLELAARAGYDPNAALTLWQKMADASQGNQPPAFLSTHPSDAARMDDLRHLIPTVTPLYNAAPKT